MHSISIIILNITNNTELINNIQKYITYERINEIIICNTNEECLTNYNEFNNNKIKIRNDYNLFIKFGLNLRFYVGEKAANEHIIFLDDNFFLCEKDFLSLLNTYEINNCIVGFYGRNKHSYNKFSQNIKNEYGYTYIINTKCMIQSKILCNIYIKFLPIINSIFCNIEPKGYACDILNSFLSTIYYNKLNIAIKTNNENKDIRDVLEYKKIYKIYRIKIINQLWGNSNLFKMKIDSIILRNNLNYINNEKRLVLSMAIGSKHNEIKKITEKNLKKYSLKCNADFKTITNIKFNDNINYIKTGEHNGIKNNQAYIQKVLLIIKYLEKYDRILWIDDTVIINSSTPNIFDLIPDGYVAGKQEAQTYNSSYFDKKYIFKHKKFKIIRNNYINSGFVIYPNKIMNILKNSLRLNYKLFESKYPHQAFLNYTIQYYKIPLICLSDTWNSDCINYIQNKFPRNYHIFRRLHYFFNNIDVNYLNENDKFIYHITGGHGDLNSRIRILSKLNEEINLIEINKIISKKKKYNLYNILTYIMFLTNFMFYSLRNKIFN